MRYMSFDSIGRVTGNVLQPEEGYYEVSDQVFATHQQHPEYRWLTYPTLPVALNPEPPPPPPPPYIPTRISMRQCRLELLAQGYLDAVNSAVSYMPQSAQIEWEYATEVERTNPLVPQMQQLLGLTDAEMDNLYAEASKR